MTTYYIYPDGEVYEDTMLGWKSDDYIQLERFSEYGFWEDKTWTTALLLDVTEGEWCRAVLYARGRMLFILRPSELQPPCTTAEAFVRKDAETMSRLEAEFKNSKSNSLLNFIVERGYYK